MSWLGTLWARFVRKSERGLPGRVQRKPLEILEDYLEHEVAHEVSAKLPYPFSHYPYEPIGPHGKAVLENYNKEYDRLYDEHLEKLVARLVVSVRGNHDKPRRPDSTAVGPSPH